MLMSQRPQLTAQDYHEAFATEAANLYPAVTAFEVRCGYALDPSRYLDAARVLACPIKTNQPNWQHGRVLYAVAMQTLFRNPDLQFRLLDIGTAKGYSALCLLWALKDSGRAGFYGHVVSVDVVDPAVRQRRNTVAEVDGYLTLAETLSPWPEAEAIRFQRTTGIDWLQANKERIHVAVVDGKHDGDVVLKEGKLLADRQIAGDRVMFDDMQIPALKRAVQQLDPYDFEFMTVKPERQYAIGVRR